MKKRYVFKIYPLFYQLYFSFFFQIIEDLTKKQKKKKLTPAERAELARQEEEKLRKIETELADAEADPKTADQFDRLVLADPNNSMMWIKYIAFHLEVCSKIKIKKVHVFYRFYILGHGN